jgi:hypothetical protein
MYFKNIGTVVKYNEIFYNYDYVQIIKIISFEIINNYKNLTFIPDINKYIELYHIILEILMRKFNNF